MYIQILNKVPVIWRCIIETKSTVRAAAQFDIFKSIALTVVT